MHAARSRRVWLVCAAVVAVALVVPAGARLVARYDHDDTVWANAMRSAGGWSRPYDFDIFLAASNDVLAGRDPYPRGRELEGEIGSPYAYPPVLALAITPLAVLPETVARTFVPGVLFTLLLLAATVGALLLLDVRDWRCYVVALAYPVTFEAVEYGAIGPILLLALALGWRFRDRLWIAAGAVGAAVVLKLFLWPMLVWLAVTRRFRAALVGAVVTFGLALVSWAAIGFHGLADYTDLLSKLSKIEAANSYSAYAILRALGVPGGASQLLVALAGLALLVLAWWAAHDAASEHTERDRRSFTLALGAALVLTPILWLHYLVLLVLPIALARPRFSALWLVPLVMVLFEALDWYRGWPRGDGRALASVCAVVGIVLLGALASRRPARDGTRVSPARA